MEGVAKTALWVAAWRAGESERDDALFRDPYARLLAGDEGFETLRASEASRGSVSTIEIRTHFYDGRLLAAVRERGLRQVVIVAAGMDARAWRLDWPDGVRLFEIDQAHVLEYKSAKLATTGAALRCERHAIAADLREDWPAALRAAGFDPARPTLWLVEGLLAYLDESAAANLFTRIDSVSATGSVALFDVIGRVLLESPWMTAAREFVATLGAPWRFSTDEPETLLGAPGWDTTAHDLGEIGTKLGRWPFPVAAREVKGTPRSWLVESIKR
jgi:methyltransferase (TIGR00027 family)